jgi:hypothetical protein
MGSFLVLLGDLMKTRVHILPANPTSDLVSNAYAHYSAPAGCRRNVNTEKRPPVRVGLLEQRP